MRTLKKTLLSTAAVAVAGVGLTLPSASAATVGGYAGLPNQSSQASCFGESWGTVINKCGSTMVWEIPLYTNSVGDYGVNVTTSCNASVRCEEFSMYGDGLAYATWAGTAPPPTGSNPWASQTWAMDTNMYGPYVPNNGYLYAACWLPPECSWQSVNWYLSP